MSTPQKGWGTPDACSSPLLKESSASPEDTPYLTKSSADPSVVIEDVVDDEDEAPAPDKLGSSNCEEHPQEFQTMRVTPCEEGTD